MLNKDELIIKIKEKMDELEQCSNSNNSLNDYEPGQWLINDTIALLVKAMDQVEIEVAFKLESIKYDCAYITIYELNGHNAVVVFENNEFPKAVLSLFTIGDKPDWVKE